MSFTVSSPRGNVRASAWLWTSVLTTAAIYAALAYWGIEFTRSGDRIAALWLPNAVVVGVLLRTRSNTCPFYIGACLVANIAINFLVSDAAFTAVTLAVANAVETVAAVVVMRRLFGRNPAIDQLRVLGGLLVVCLLAPMLSGMIAAVALAPANVVADVDVFLAWVLSDGLGLMIVTPIVMIALDAWRSRRTISSRDVVEWASVMIATALITAVIFGQSRFPFLFLACPIVMLAAFRTGIVGTAAATAIISFVASVATMFGSGPIMLVQGDLGAKLIALQLFLATSFAMGLPVAAALAGRTALRRDLLENRSFTTTILNNIQEVIFRTDADGRWLFLNPAWEVITGYSVEESLGWSTLRLLHPEDKAAAVEVYPRIISGEIEQATLRQRFFHASGDCRHIEVLVRRLADDRGNFIGTTGNIRDVSDAVRHERSLADSEARFRCMAEAAPVGIFRADPQGQITYVNRLWAQKIGFTVEETLGDGWMRALADTDAYDGDPAFVGFNKPGDVKRRTARFRGADGCDLWVETVNTAEFDDAGAITGFVGVVQDITEQRRASEALRESERRFQTLADLAPAGIFRTDAAGRCTYVNNAWLGISGLASDAWQEEGWVVALHPDDRERVFTGWAAAVAAQRDYRDEFRWVRPDGSCSWVDVLGRPELDDTGAVRGFIGVNIDITERRKAEADLAERDAQLTLLANNATDAVVRLDLDGRCKYASPSTRALLGVAPRHLIGAQMLDRFHPDDAASVTAAFASLASGDVDDTIIAYRSELVGEPGVYRWLEAHCGLVRGDDNAPMEIIASIRDVSKNKALEEDLRQARKTAESAASAKAAFLANMSHEIRTPMNGVLGFTELLAASPLDPEQRRHLDLIADSGRAMMRLLNDILDISKIDSGGMQLTAEPVDLRHKLSACARLMKPLARKKGVELRVAADAELPEYIIGDPLRLRQVLLNLIGNAVKFTDHGSIIVSARADRLGDDTLVVDVKDTGPGIPADQLDAIFQQFSQADSSIARKFGGTGLGLPISNELVRLMGGTITVQSEVGIGTTFTVRLPLIASERSAVSGDPDNPEAEQPDPAPLATTALRVLIAEDHDINQELIMALATSAGMIPTIATDGDQAIDLVCAADDAGEPFAMVLMDMQMPVMDGLEATRQLRAMGFSADRLPIIALTANAYADDRQACIDAGMQEHLSKPVRLRNLKAIADRYVGARAGDLGVAEPAKGPSSALVSQYQDRRRETLDAVAAAIRRGELMGEDLQALADKLHKLAGTAGFFGEDGLGDAAAALERALLAAEPDNIAAVLTTGSAALARAA